MSILILGDCHASWRSLVGAITKGATRHGATVAIQVGDFGFFPSHFALLETVLTGQPFPIPVHVIDGNHEDHAWLWKQGAIGRFARWAQDYNLFVHRRGDTTRIEGISVGFLGGALHADRSQHGRISKGSTNWVTNRDADRASHAFTTAEVDLMVTHSCPHSIGVGMRGAAELFLTVERYVRAKGFDSGPIEDCGEPGLVRLWTQLKHQPRAWVFGHFHTHRKAMVGDTEFRCVGSSDGSDGRVRILGHLLDPALWVWSEVEL